MPENKRAIRTHKAMLVMFGEVDDQCKNCAFLRHRSAGNKTFYKCSASKIDHMSVTSDWRVRWKACGKFESQSKASAIIQFVEILNNTIQKIEEIELNEGVRP